MKYLLLIYTDRYSSQKNIESFEDKKKVAMKKSADHENVVVLSLVIEASIEASFQESVSKSKIISMDFKTFCFSSFSRQCSSSPRL